VLVPAVALVATAGGTAAASASAFGGGSGDNGSTAVLGPKDVAKGDPLTVGFMVDAGGEAIDTSEYEIAGQATAKYINQRLGGLDGRPVKIDFCDNDASSAGATKCVNEFVQAGASAILVGSTGFGEVAASAASEAGIPYVAFLGAAASELVGPGAFSLSGSAVSILGSPAVEMQKEDDAKKLAVLTIDVPTATQAIEAFAVPAYDKLGLEVELIPVAPGTADMSANVTTAQDADAWLVLGDAAFCTTALEAIKTQVTDVPIYVSVQCISPDTAQRVPGGFKGITAVAANRLDPKDPETDVFEAVLDEYASADDLKDAAPGFLADGYSTVLGFARLMDGYTGDGSAATVLEHLSSATGELPLGGGTEMECGNSPISFLPDLCSVNSWLIKLNAKGKQVGFKPVDVTPVFNS
jgi:branched-chain amino acid transport system substrate-binding protein